MTVELPEVEETTQLDEQALRAYLTRLVPALKAKRKRLKPVVEHLEMTGKTFAPRGQTAEHRYLDALTHTPWGWKIAVTFAHEMNVNGFRSPGMDPSVNDPAWQRWEDARMAIMQDILIREAMLYGESFGAALSTATGGAITKPLPPVHTVAEYEDPVTDVWPEAVLSTLADRKGANRPSKGTLYIGDWVYSVDFPDGLDADTAVFGDAWQHNMEQTPVVRVICEIDSMGNTVGKIALLLALLERIRKDTYDRQLIQHKSSWKVRYATGLEPDDDSGESTEQAKMRLAVEDVLVSSDPQVRFGTLDETPLENLIAAKEADVFELCSLAQIPPSAIMPGKISNLAAETITELRATFDNAVSDHQEVMGDSFRWLILALAVQAGDEPNMQARTQWSDRSSRSLAQAMDAWSKGVPTMDIPVEAAWERLPGVGQDDVQRWANMRKREQGRQAAAAMFGRAPAAEPAADPAVESEGEQ